jgi:hypothetical protein
VHLAEEDKVLSSRGRFGSQWYICSLHGYQLSCMTTFELFS